MRRIASRTQQFMQDRDRQNLPSYKSSKAIQTLNQA